MRVFLDESKISDIEYNLNVLRKKLGFGLENIISNKKSKKYMEFLRERKDLVNRIDSIQSIIDDSKKYLK